MIKITTNEDDHRLLRLGQLPRGAVWRKERGSDPYMEVHPYTEGVQVCLNLKSGSTCRVADSAFVRAARSASMEIEW